MATPLRLSFLSINAGGLNQARKRRQVFRWAHNSKADIIFLQETYSTESVEYGDQNGVAKSITAIDLDIPGVWWFYLTQNSTFK